MLLGESWESDRSKLVAIQPVTYRPIPPVKPVARRPDEESPRKVTDRKSKRGRTPDPGTGENLDTWV